MRGTTCKVVERSIRKKCEGSELEFGWKSSFSLNNMSCYFSTKSNTKVCFLQIYEDDQLPQQLCEECITTVSTLDKTIRTYRDNDEKLRKLLYESGHVMVKEELAEMEAEYLLEPEMYVRSEFGTGINI